MPPILVLIEPPPSRRYAINSGDADQQIAFWWSNSSPGWRRPNRFAHKISKQSYDSEQLKAQEAGPGQRCSKPESNDGDQSDLHSGILIFLHIIFQEGIPSDL